MPTYRTNRSHSSAQSKEPNAAAADDKQLAQPSHNKVNYLHSVFSARFVAEHQLTLNKMKHALDLYEATNGYKPKSHEEYMQAIVLDNYIELPELRDDYEYWYDAEQGELMMRKPITIK